MPTLTYIYTNATLTQKLFFIPTRFGQKGTVDLAGLFLGVQFRKYYNLKVFFPYYKILSNFQDPRSKGYLFEIHFKKIPLDIFVIILP